MNYAVQHSQRYSKIFLKIIIIKQQINIQFNFKQGKKSWNWAFLLKLHTWKNVQSWLLIKFKSKPHKI